jgi:DNA-binding GntR family transcriptional regulator
MNMSASTLAPIEHVSINDRAYAVLRESILRRTFAPGEQLNLEQLEAQLGVSRTPLKHALTRLTMEGLVKITPRRGTYVAELNPEDIAQRFDMRRFLEVGAAEEAVRRMTPAGLAQMQQIAQILDDMVTPDGECADYEMYLQRDREFHSTFISFVGNKILSEAHESLNVHLYVARVAYGGWDKHLDRVNKEHEEFLHVLKARDVPSVIRAISNHLEKSKQDILSRMRANS